jgi:hypothetical protein
VVVLVSEKQLLAPFPWFGGKRKVAADVWARLGSPKQYIEPFCGSAAILLAAPSVASLEVVGDMNGFIANFWRAVKYQPGRVAEWADYPVSHIDQGARHVWLHRRRETLAEGLADAEWPGDAQAAGWWLWGQCSWIGSGWAEWDRSSEPGAIGRSRTSATRGGAFRRSARSRTSATRGWGTADLGAGARRGSGCTASPTVWSACASSTATGRGA